MRDNEQGTLFQIDNTSVGDAEFQLLSLTSFATVKLFDNIFSDLRYTNMQWKEIVEVGEYDENGISEVEKKETLIEL